ncbi:MAG: hypothetical protein Kow0031_03730 [Anaerolineae bacterium]
MFSTSIITVGLAGAAGGACGGWGVVFGVPEAGSFSGKAKLGPLSSCVAAHAAGGRATGGVLVAQTGNRFGPAASNFRP